MTFKKNKFGQFTVESYTNKDSIVMVKIWGKYRQKMNRIDISNRPHMCVQLYLNKGAKVIQCKKDNLFNNQ